MFSTKTIGFETAMPKDKKDFELSLKTGEDHIIIFRQSINRGKLSIQHNKIVIIPPEKSDDELEAEAI